MLIKTPFEKYFIIYLNLIKILLLWFELRVTCHLKRYSFYWKTLKINVYLFNQDILTLIRFPKLYDKIALGYRFAVKIILKNE